MYGENTFVPDERIIYGTDSLIVNIAFGAVDDVKNIAEDAGDVTVDVLANDEVFAGSTGELTITDVVPGSHGS